MPARAHLPSGLHILKYKSNRIFENVSLPSLPTACAFRHRSPHPPESAYESNSTAKAKTQTQTQWREHATPNRPSGEGRPAQCSSRPSRHKHQAKNVYKVIKQCESHFKEIRDLGFFYQHQTTNSQPALTLCLKFL